MKPKQPFQKIDLVLVLISLVGIILFWIRVDEKGYLLYSGIIVMTLVTVGRQLSDKEYKFRYSKWLLIIITAIIVITGIDQMTSKKLGVTIFPLVYIIYLLIQPKPIWINRP